MKRLIRLLGWRGVRLGVFVMFVGPGVAWAQTNTFPASGSVGIGTTSPTGKLTVNTGADKTIVFGQDASFPTYNLFSLNGNLTDTGFTGFASGAFADNALYIQAAAGPQARISFRTNGTSERMRIDTAGNVGIGTTSPLTKLHVVGDVQVDGNLAAKYQDVAEWVVAPTAVPPGVVVVVDSQARNQVLPASGPYDTRVAGVVSYRPGLLLGEAGEGKVKVAHSGRVKVKVDASYGPIAAGDLLVTSPTSGYAMRSVPIELGGTLIHRPGTVLGKALEPLKEGQDEILVLLTLQ